MDTAKLSLDKYAFNARVVPALIVLTQICPDWYETALEKPVAWVAFILDLSFLIIWIFVVDRGWIRSAADAYARQLLEAIDVLEPKKAPVQEN